MSKKKGSEEKKNNGKKVTYVFPKKLHKALKLYCITVNKSMNEFVVEIVKEALSKNGTVIPDDEDD